MKKLLIWHKKLTQEDISQQIGISVKKIQHVMKDLDIKIINDDSIDLIGDMLNLEIKKNPTATSIIENIKQYKHIDNRFPIISIMGHVDHGKTTLMETLKGNKNVEIHEDGGITQNISVQKINLNGRDVILLDTPGHSAFNTLREKVIEICDFVVVVVAANDGVKEQTKDVLRLAKNKIIAINKIDLTKDLNKVYDSLARNNVIVEQYGGEVPCVAISALKNEGIDLLIENIQIYGDILDIKANSNDCAVGFVVDSFIKHGMGVICRIVLHSGTINSGDTYIIGRSMGVIKRFLVDGKIAKKASFNHIIDLIVDEPQAVGSLFFTCKPVEAKIVANETISAHSNLIKENGINIILKALNANSLISLQNAFAEYNIVHSSIGPITDNEIHLQQNTNSHFILLGDFKKSLRLLQRVKNKYFNNTVIYKLIESFQEFVNPKDKVTYSVVGQGKIVKIFNINNKEICGFQVIDGEIPKKSLCKIEKLTPDGRIEIATGSIASMEREKNMIDVAPKGSEAGVVINYKTKLEPITENDCFLVALKENKIEDSK